MKKIISLVTVIALVLCMIPAVYADPAEETVKLTPGSHTVSLVPDTNYILRIDLGSIQVPVGSLSWAGNVTVAVGGSVITSPYDLSRYTPKTALVATVTEATDVTFVITLPEEETLALALGANAVEVPAGYNGKTATFTAPEAGEYLLSAPEGEERAAASLISKDSVGNDMLQALELPYYFAMDAGETVTLSIYASDGVADTVDLVLERQEVVSRILEVGVTGLTLLPNTSYLIRLGFVNNPSGVLCWDSSAVTVTVKNLEVTSPAVIKSYSPLVTITATVEAKTDVTFTLTEDAMPELVLGANSIDVQDGAEGTTLRFTAARAGQYVLTAAEGEENAYLLLTVGNETEDIALPAVLEMEAGASFDLTVATVDYTSDTIDLLLRQICGHTPPSMVEVMPETAAGDHTLGIKALYICPDCGEIFDADGNPIDLDDQDVYLSLLYMPNHWETMEEVAEVPATVTSEGMAAHICCTQCDRYFIADETAEAVDAIIQEVTRESLIIPMLPFYTPGDVNGDSHTNILDVMSIINYITGVYTLTDIQMLVADINADGAVNIMDAMALINYITGADV